MRLRHWGNNVLQSEIMITLERRDSDGFHHDEGPLGQEIFNDEKRRGTVTE